MILYHCEIGPKLWIARYFKKLWTDSDETQWMSQFGDENKLIRFWCVTKMNGPDVDPAYQCDTKRKLFSLAEVCALPSAILVLTVFTVDIKMIVT